jgi:hypothetical protein
MLTLPAAGQRMQREMLKLEETINLAMAQAAALTQSCALARNIPGVGASTGQTTMLRLSSLSQHLVQSASDAARVHDGLRGLNREREVMMADGDGGCPPVQPSGVIAA